MQLFGKNYLEKAGETADNNQELELTEEDLGENEALEALCRAVEGGGRVRFPSWMSAAADMVRENKRHLAAAASVLVIGFAVYLNWAMYQGDKSETPNADGVLSTVGEQQTGDGLSVSADGGEKVPGDDYFAVSQINRQRARDEAIEVLQNVVEGAENLSEVQNEALAEIAKIAEDIEHEAAIESLVKGKGFTECVAVISGDNANVIVKSAALLPNEIAQIQEIVFETAGIIPANVKIIEK